MVAIDELIPDTDKHPAASTLQMDTSTAHSTGACGTAATNEIAATNLISVFTPNPTM